MNKKELAVYVNILFQVLVNKNPMFEDINDG